LFGVSKPVAGKFGRKPKRLSSRGCPLNIAQAELDAEAWRIMSF
jgi:hypothetical protein